jgi:WD40 repeat protein
LVFGHKIGAGWKPEANEWMNFVAISSDGSTVASNGNVPGNKDGGVGLWTFPAGEYLRSIAGRGPLALSMDFRYLATQTSVLDLQTGKSILRISSQPDRFGSAAVSATSEYVALAKSRRAAKNKLGQISVLRMLDASVMSSFCTRYTGSLAFHPDGHTLASGHWNNVTLWDVRTGVRLALLIGVQRPVDANGYQRDGRYMCGVGFSRDGKVLAAGSDDGELQVWEVGTGKLLHSLKIGWSDVSNPAFSPDGKLVAAGTYADGTVSLVDVQSGKILSQVQVSMFGCGSVAFSPDGKYLVTPSNDGGLNNGKHGRGGTIRVFRVAE